MLAIIVWTVQDVIMAAVLSVIGVVMLCALAVQLACRAWEKIRSWFGRGKAKLS